MGPVEGCAVNMKIEFTPEDNVSLADKEIAAVLEKYQVEWRGDFDCEMWLEPIEPEPPKLKIV